MRMPTWEPSLLRRQDSAGSEEAPGGRRGWYRRACEQAHAGKLREQSPGYVIERTPAGWNAVHEHSGTVLGPARTVARLAGEIDLDRWSRAAVTAAGIPIRIRPGGAR